MHPILVEIGPVTIYSYGFFIAMAFLAGMGWTMREARFRGMNPALVSDLGFYIILGAIIGSRLLYVLLNLSFFLSNPLETIKFWKGGLVFSGGFILAVVLGYLYLRRKQQSFRPWLDACAPGLALGQAIGRLGCVSAGCCYGASCDLPWAVVFTDTNSLAPLFRPIHPTQIYHSLAGLTTFIILLLAKKFLKGQGALMGLFLIQFAIFRFIIEFFRDDYRGHVGFLSVTQVLAICAFGLGLWLFVSGRRNAAHTP
ncbi:MAG: prolipoprotein diacylglyceryl transferase [Deltaproteobacteria bacterium]|nr:prolipoprotein diacylglyceryl transferase [Deltaproteobacteria bacterium]